MELGHTPRLTRHAERMARIDHYRDPNAPRANSLVPAAVAAVFDGDDRILLQRRVDNELWALPGGTMDVGETIAQTAIREVKEETGIDANITGIVGVYSDPAHVIEYSDGEVRQQFAICFKALRVGGDLHASSESTELKWVGQAEVDRLRLHPTMRLRVGHAFEARSEPYIG